MSPLVGRVRREHILVNVHKSLSVYVGSVGDTIPGVTEPSGLTSDSIVYGGPQGSNPHFLRELTVLRERV